MIVLDTSVLSLAFRRTAPLSPVAIRLRQLIADDEPMAIPGIVLQEILSGLREAAQFKRMQEALTGFPVLLATRSDHLAAARVANTCRRSGIATTAPDCLIAAQAIHQEAQLWTTDQDFSHIAHHCALRLLRS